MSDERDPKRLDLSDRQAQLVRENQSRASELSATLGQTRARYLRAEHLILREVERLEQQLQQRLTAAAEELDIDLSRYEFDMESMSFTPKPGE